MALINLGMTETSKSMKIIARGLNRLQSEIRAKLFQLVNLSSISLGRHVRLGKNSRLAVVGKGRIEIGDNTFINGNSTIISHNYIRIGDNCLLGVNVSIFDHDHRFKDANTPINRQGFNTAPVLIGDNCWIGSNVFIAKGVSIGDNSVIAACSRIDQSVPPNTLVRIETNIRFEKINHTCSSNYIVDGDNNENTALHKAMD